MPSMENLKARGIATEVNPKQLPVVSDISAHYITAGEAVFTITYPPGTDKFAPAKGGHFTYRVEHKGPKDNPAKYRKDIWFVALLVDANDFAYIGMLDDFTGNVRATAASKRPPTCLPFQLLNRVLARVWSGDLATIRQHGFDIQHSGCCSRCGLELTNPKSLRAGIGPECAKALGIALE